MPLADLTPDVADNVPEPDSDAIHALARSIRFEGLTEPLIGYHQGPTLRIVDGHRRLAALEALYGDPDSADPRNRQVAVWIADRQEALIAASRANMRRPDRSAIDRAQAIREAYVTATACGDATAATPLTGDDRRAALACLKAHIGVSGETARRYLNHAELPEDDLAGLHGTAQDASTWLDTLGREPTAEKTGDAGTERADATEAALATDGSDDRRQSGPAPADRAAATAGGYSPQAVAHALNACSHEAANRFFRDLSGTLTARVLRIAQHYMTVPDDGAPSSAPQPASARRTGNRGKTGGGPAGPSVSDRRAKDVADRLRRARQNYTLSEIEDATDVPKATASQVASEDRNPSDATAERVEARIAPDGTVTARTAS